LTGPVVGMILLVLGPQSPGYVSRTVLLDRSQMAEISMPKLNGHTLATLLLCAAASIVTYAQTSRELTNTQTSRLQVLYSFAGGNDGRHPRGGLLADSAGNLYGTTASGGNPALCGNDGCGTVYELSPPGDGSSSWSETVLYSFTGSGDGSTPVGSLVMDQAGNLYGVTNQGGQLSGSECQQGGGPAVGCGVVFQLSPPTSGGSWTETTLHSFVGSDGALPEAGLVFDSSGNLYGTTTLGGSSGGCSGPHSTIGCGEVFELSPPSVQGGAWAFAVVHQFTGGIDGGLPEDNLIVDELGNLYGTAGTGGLAGGGIVFRMIPPGASGGAWKEENLFGFPGESFPYASLVRDSQGNLYGTTTGGPGADFLGYVFELSPVIGEKWKLTILYVLGPTTDFPQAGLVFDSLGNLYGTGGSGCGSVFRLERHANWKETEVDFHGFDAEPCGLKAPVIIGSPNGLYGTSVVGGSSKLGTVFAILP